MFNMNELMELCYIMLTLRLFALAK